MKDQPLPVDASPTALSLGYIVDPDSKEDEEDPKEDPADYLATGGENDDNESSDDDDDDDDVVKDEEDKEEEEHLASVELSNVPIDDLGAPISIDTELGGYVREFETRVRHDTDEIYMREAWVRATDASDLVHGEVMSLRTTVLGQMSEIKELQAADRR
nr:hypothetical protein [Tanacetum cinerariifolium]